MLKKDKYHHRTREYLHTTSNKSRQPRPSIFWPQFKKRCKGRLIPPIFFWPHQLSLTATCKRDLLVDLPTICSQMQCSPSPSPLCFRLPHFLIFSSTIELIWKKVSCKKDSAATKSCQDLGYRSLFVPQARISPHLPRYMDTAWARISAQKQANKQIKPL